MINNLSWWERPHHKKNYPNTIVFVADATALRGANAQSLTRYLKEGNSAVAALSTSAFSPSISSLSSLPSCLRLSSFLCASTSILTIFTWVLDSCFSFQYLWQWCLTADTEVGTLQRTKEIISPLLAYWLWSLLCSFMCGLFSTLITNMRVTTYTQDGVTRKTKKTTTKLLKKFTW